VRVIHGFGGSAVQHDADTHLKAVMVRACLVRHFQYKNRLTSEETVAEEDMVSGPQQ
jgi:hypothetical protein